MKNTWALITGASSGIGRSLSLELAKKEYNVILHGRNTTELQSLSDKIQQDYRVKTKVVELDLDNKNLAPLFEACEGKDIQVLVNNAGFGVGGNFADTDLSKELSMVHVHIDAVMRLTKFILFRMDKDSDNYILNVSSLYSFFPVPKQAIYSASKTFIHNFSLALSEEFAKTKITIFSLCPGLTYSKFRTRQSKPEKKMFVGMTSDEVAHVAIKKLFKRKIIIVPGLFNNLMRFIIPKLPTKLGLKIIHQMNKQRGF